MEGSFPCRCFRGDAGHVKEGNTAGGGGRGAKGLELIFIRTNEHAIDDGDFVEGLLADPISQDGIEVILLL